MYKISRNILYIDAANLIMSARTFGIKYDTYSLFKYLKDRYRISRCVYFTAKISSLNQDYEFIQSLGVEIVFKEIYKENNKSKANCDVEISNRITEDVLKNAVDNVFLLSGGGDFLSLLNYVQKHQKNVTCISLSRKNTSKVLKKRRDFNISFIEEYRLKGKGPVGHVASTGVLFFSSNISNSQNLSNDNLLTNS